MKYWPDQVIPAWYFTKAARCSRDHALFPGVLTAYAAQMRSGDGNDDGDGGDWDDILLPLAAAIHAALERGIDPYALAGVLVEGAAYVVTHTLSVDERDKAVALLVVKLHECLKERGAG